MFYDRERRLVAMPRTCFLLSCRSGGFRSLTCADRGKRRVFLEDDGNLLPARRRHDIAVLHQLDLRHFVHRKENSLAEDCVDEMQ